MILVVVLVPSIRQDLADTGVTFVTFQRANAKSLTLPAPGHVRVDDEKSVQITEGLGSIRGKGNVVDRVPARTTLTTFVGYIAVEVVKEGGAHNCWRWTLFDKVDVVLVTRSSHQNRWHTSSGREMPYHVAVAEEERHLVAKIPNTVTGGT